MFESRNKKKNSGLLFCIDWLTKDIKSCQPGPPKTKQSEGPRGVWRTNWKNNYTNYDRVRVHAQINK